MKVYNFRGDVSNILAKTGVNKIKALAMLLSDQASDIIRRLGTASNIGERLNVWRPYSIVGCGAWGVS